MRQYFPGLQVFVLFLSFRCAFTLNDFEPPRREKLAFLVSKPRFQDDFTKITGEDIDDENDDFDVQRNNRFRSFHQRLVRNFSIDSNDSPVFDGPGVVKRLKNNSSSGITEREASYHTYWNSYDDDDDDEDGDGDCHPSCFCEFPDKATCVGPRINFIPTRLNPFLTLLEILDASLLSIRTDSFSHYPHLQHLSLINCSVVKLEAFAFRGLAGLKTFNFNLNPLTHLSRYSFSGVFNVRVMNLTRNRIKRIHSLAFESSSFIGKLLLDRNPLAHISARAFLGLSHVESLVVSEISHPTPVVTLEPDAFWGLEEVKDLHLDGIPATRLTPFSFRGLSNVAHLYLRRSAVAVIEPHAFSGLVNVAYLHMDESKVKSIQATAFSDMINVSYVDLSKNQLYELSPESLDGIDGVVEHLDLMENPWHCNCSIHWMRTAANKLDHVTTLTRSMMSLRCHTPPEMRGRYLAQLDDRVMRCPTVAVERRVRQGEDPVATTSAAASSAGGALFAAAPSFASSFAILRVSRQKLVAVDRFSSSWSSPSSSSPPPSSSSSSSSSTSSSSRNFITATSVEPSATAAAIITPPSITTLAYSETYLTVNHYLSLTYSSRRIIVTLLLSLFYNRVLSFYGNGTIITTT